MSDEAKIILKDMQIEEMRKEIISQDQFIAQLEKEYGKEIKRLNNIIKHTDSWVDITIEIIKQQPSGNDEWILERLNGIKQCLKDSDKE